MTNARHKCKWTEKFREDEMEELDLETCTGFYCSAAVPEWAELQLLEHIGYWERLSGVEEICEHQKDCKLFQKKYVFAFIRPHI